MDRFKEKQTKIKGVFSISKTLVGDDRGNIERLFCLNEIHGWSNRPVKQVNKSFTAKKGTIRGFHFQKPPKAEAKLICCLRGKVTDFALDLRKKSRTYGKIFKIELDENLHNAVIIPEGVAHGFQTLTDNVEMLYFHSEFYSPDMESGVNMLDSSLNLKFEHDCSLISERDRQLQLFHELEGLEL